MSTPPTTTTLPTPPQGSTTATTKPSPSSAGSSTPKDSPSKTPSVAATRRAQFASCHGSGTSSPATSFGRGRLPPDRQASLRRRRSSYGRRGSSFDIPHSNSLPCVPVDLKGLEGINEKEVPWWTSQRFTLAIICFFGFLVLYAQRVNLSIAIVSMVDHSNHPPVLGIPTNNTYNTTSDIVNISSSNIYNDSGTAGHYGNMSKGGNAHVNTTMQTKKEEAESCPTQTTASSSTGEFRWSKSLQGLILGAFFWGYLLLQVTGGLVSERFGAKKVIAAGMVPVAILSLLSPVAARADPNLFLILRILMGVGEGVMYPAAQALWSRWAPPNERSRLIGFSYAGGQFGNALIFPIGGFLCAYGFDGGWPSVFYVIGTCGFIWCVVWIVFVADSPDQNSRISDIEKKYINLSLGDRAMNKTRGSTPWKAIFTSRGVWAILVAHVCGNYGAYMLLTQIPTYMKEVLKFDIKANGLYSMLPYLLFWLFITVSGMLADFLISRDILSVAWTRKLMACIGMLGPGSFLIGTGFMECRQQSEAVAMLTIAVGLCGFHFSGYFINHGDIAPAYAGTLFGITNTAATVPGIVAPYVVSALTTNGAREEWQKAFYVAAAVYFFGAAFYVIMGQGEIQPWANVTTADDEDAEARKGFDLHKIHEVHERGGGGGGGGGGGEERRTVRPEDASGWRWRSE